MMQRTLEDYRTSAGLSRIGLAQLARVHHCTVWRIEHGQHVPLVATRRKLATALRIKRPDAIQWPEEVSKACYQ